MTKDCKEVFTDIYRDRVWGDGSGGGSAPDVAKPYIDFVSAYLAWPPFPLSPLGGTVLDIGSGDGVVAGKINWNEYDYIGVDASGKPSCYGISQIGGPSVTYMGGFDALKDPLPEADLVLCKEVLQHLSNEQIQLLLDRTAHYPRRLFTNTNHPSLPVNTDIETGDCRAVDLTLAPFNQPAKTVFTYGHWIVQELTTP